MLFPDFWRVVGALLGDTVLTQQIHVPESSLAADLLHVQQKTNVPALQLLGTR